MYYPKELFSINETATRRNLRAYDLRQTEIKQKAMLLEPNYKKLNLIEQAAIRELIELGKLGPVNELAKSFKKWKESNGKE